MFRTKGYAATSIRDLANRLGIRNASLYHYIRTKDELLFEIARQALEQLQAEVRPIVLSDLPPLEKLRRFIETHTAVILREQDKHAAMLTQLGALPPARRKAIVRLRDGYEDLVALVLEEGQQRGVIRADIPAKYLKLALFNLLNWSIFWFRPNGPLAPAGLGKILAEIYLGGIAARKEGPQGNQADARRRNRAQRR